MTPCPHVAPYRYMLHASYICSTQKPATCYMRNDFRRKKEGGKKEGGNSKRFLNIDGSSTTNTYEFLAAPMQLHAPTYYTYTWSTAA